MQPECLKQIFEVLHQAHVTIVDAAHISQGMYIGISGECLVRRMADPATIHLE
jgi:hypothetical protein